MADGNGTTEVEGVDKGEKPGKDDVGAGGWPADGMAAGEKPGGGGKDEKAGRDGGGEADGTGGWNHSPSPGYRGPAPAAGGPPAGVPSGGADQCTGRDTEGGATRGSGRDPGEAGGSPAGDTKPDQARGAAGGGVLEEGGVAEDGGSAGRFLPNLLTIVAPPPRRAPAPLTSDTDRGTDQIDDLRKTSRKQAGNKGLAQPVRRGPRPAPYEISFDPA